MLGCMDRSNEDSEALVPTSLAAGALLALLWAITVASGTSQQFFEWALPPAVYARALVAHAAPLRTIVAIDDVFVAAYVSATLFLALRLGAGRGRILALLVGVGGVTAGLLDLEENHHLLALARLAENDVAIPLAEIVHRTTASQLKWMIAHLAFVLAGFAMTGTSRFLPIVRVSLIALQLPLGALVWAVEDPAFRPLLVSARYASLIVGFLAVAFLYREPSPTRGVGVAAGSGAPA